MNSSNFIYHDGKQELCGYLAQDKHEKQKRPGVLVVHDWSGRNEFACKKAEKLAKMGYVGFAVDMFGSAQVGTSIEEKQALIQPLMADRAQLRTRIKAGLDALLSIPEVDKNHIAAIGFCFGGLCVLDLARSGTKIAGVISFHGLLNKPEGISHHMIKAKVLALHGYDDPMVPPEQVQEFCNEMTKEQVDWQVHMYGHTQHAFTNPQAHDKNLGTIYNAKAEYRSWLAMTDFLSELFS